MKYQEFIDLYCHPQQLGVESPAPHPPMTIANPLEYMLSPVSSLVRRVASEPPPSGDVAPKAPTLIDHSAAVVGIGKTIRLMEQMFKEHRKVLIYTSVHLVKLTAREAERWGIPAFTMVSQDRPTERGETIKAFNEAESGVFITTLPLAFGWRVNATAIFCISCRLKVGSGIYRQAVTRCNPEVVHLYDCQIIR